MGLSSGDKEVANVAWEKILFYTDLSPGADLAFPFALGLASRNPTSHLFVVHVLPSPYRFYAEIVDSAMAAGLNPDVARLAEEELRSRYGQAVEGVGTSSFHVLVGVEGVELVRFVKRRAVEVLVLAASVAEAKMTPIGMSLRAFLAKRSPCPVVMVQPPREVSRRTRGQSSEKVVEMRDFKRRRKKA